MTTFIDAFIDSAKYLELALDFLSFITTLVQSTSNQNSSPFHPFTSKKKPL